MRAITPPVKHLDADPITVIAGYLEQVKKCVDDGAKELKPFLSGVWLRGNGEHYTEPLVPCVFRSDFTEKAKRHCGKVPDAKTDEAKCLELERRMLNEFRTLSASHIDNDDIVKMYLVARHHGMPTRLLDWTTNPLAALFFAVEDESKDDRDGEVFVLEAKTILPKPEANVSGDDRLTDVVRFTHPYVQDAVKPSFWWPGKSREELIIPLRPDNQLGRIGQQSSCFTLHMPNLDAAKNPRSVKPKIQKIKIPKSAKSTLRSELRSLNINAFTIYYDLDHLSKAIRQSWGLSSK
jgi:hypothetical protein